MATSKSKAMRNAHARKYIEEVFAKRLQKEGFFCPDDRLLCWYRVMNDEVLQTICFYSRWSNIPLIVSIAYGVNPLFKKPFCSADVSSSNRPEGAGFITEELKADGESQWMSPYAPDAQVYAPVDCSKGLYTLDGIILPALNKIQTLVQCYEFHLHSPRHFDLAYAKNVVDMGIYLNDEGSFSAHLERVDAAIERCNRQLEKSPKSSEYAKLKQEYLLQRKTICENSRDEYIAILEKKKSRALETLEKQRDASDKRLVCVDNIEK